VLALSIGAFAGVAVADGPQDDVSQGVAAATVVADPTPSANNALSTKCGLNIVLVVDRSGSTQDFDSDYKGAADAFVNGLVGTPSHIGVVTFSSSASVLSGYVDVSSGPGNLVTLIDGLPTPTGLTNWQDALEKTTANYTAPDLAVFITDGNPTAHNGSGADLGNAITAANTLKSNGTTHITGVAVGANIDLGNIGDITGSGAGIGGLNPDVHQSDTSTLVADVKALATELCGGTVTIHKTVETGTGVFVDGPDWQFASTNAETSPVTTDAGGLANLKFDHTKLGTQTITETGPASGYTIKSVDCGSKVATVDLAKTGFTVDVGSLDIVSCDVVNTPALGSITVQKVTTHGAGGPFGFTVTGPNSVNAALDATTTVKDVAVSAGSVPSLFPGVYTINEASLPTGWALTGIDCGAATIAPTDAVVSPSVSIVLHAGENAVCTYTNDELPSDLSIVKSAAAPVAVNGDSDQQIDYTLTVDNAGPADAHADATVTDVLPAKASLVSVTPPVGVTCDTSSLPQITCTIPASQLEVADPAVVIGVRATVPTGSGTVVNKTIVSSPDDPAPCTVTADDITCSEPTDNYSQASTDVPQVAGEVVTNPPGVPPVVAAAVAQVANLAFTGSNSIPFAGLGVILVAGGLFVLVLARRRRGSAS
jgi:uncharacterized repeat protein (TIGR01451 family)